MKGKCPGCDQICLVTVGKITVCANCNHTFMVTEDDAEQVRDDQVNAEIHDNFPMVSYLSNVCK